MWNQLIRCGDLLCGAAQPRASIDRRWLLRYLALAGVLVLVIGARRPDAIFRAQIGGDGKVYFYPQLTVGFWSAFCSFYGGFPFLAQRLIAVVGGLVPTAAVALVYAATAIVVTALIMATFSLPTFRHLVRNDALRVAVCVGTICIPASEALAVMGQLGYFFAVWLVFLSVMQTPRSPAGCVVWCVAAVLAVLSAPQAPIAAPLCLLRAISALRRRDSRDLGFAASQLGAQCAMLGVGALLMAGFLGGGSELPGALPIFSEWQPEYRWAMLPTLGWLMASVVDMSILSEGVFQWLENHGTLAVLAPAMLLAILVALVFRTLWQRGRVTVCLAVYVLIASLALVLIGRPIIVLLVYGTIPNLRPSTLVALGSRHRHVPEVALLLLAAGIIDGARQVGSRVAASVVACTGLLIAWAPHFRVPPPPDCHWPLWAARLDRKLTTGSRERLVIPSCSPPFFDIVVDSPPAESMSRPGDEPQGLH